MHVATRDFSYLDQAYGPGDTVDIDVIPTHKLARLVDQGYLRVRAEDVAGLHEEIATLRAEVESLRDEVARIAKPKARKEN